MAKQKKSSSGLRFLGVMLIYALLFCAALVPGMRFLQNYVIEYEASRPYNVMDAYVASFDEAHIEAVSRDFIASLDPEIQSPEESRAAVAKLFEGPLHYARNSAESNQERSVYVISNDSRELGTVVLTGEQTSRFIYHWEVAEEHYNFDWMLDSDQITVMKGWEVSVGGQPLGPEYIVEDDLPFDYLKDFYDDEEYDLPVMCTYRIENYVGDAPFTVTNGRGEIIDGSNWTEEQCLDNCSEAEKAAMDSFVEAFLPRYILCLANSNHDAYENYRAIQPYLVSGSDLDQRLYDAIAGLVYAHSNGDTIDSVEHLRYINLGNGYYLAEIAYQLDTVGYDGHVKTQSQAQLILKQTDSGLLAYKIYSY